MNLTEAHRSQLFVSLVSKFDDTEHDGVILDLADQWCVLASIEAFDADGYWILRRDMIKRVQHRKYEAFRHQFLEAEGTLAGLRPLPDLDISTTSRLFESLLQIQKYLILYRDTEVEWWSHHAALAGINGTQLLMHSFDGAGRFNKKFTRCQMDSITSIRIGSRYLNAYQKAVPYNFQEQQPVSSKPR